MKYYMIEPEVAGEIGENTIYDNYDEIINQKKKPIISHLHYIFDGWLGDELLEVTPCFLISERLKKEIENHGFSGCRFADVEVSYSDEFSVDILMSGNMVEIHRAIKDGRNLKADRNLKQFMQLALLMSCYKKFGYL